ncbi:hypothetical protein AXFE_18110 [Acidithrix ferrooxidans]|uniref:Uncharacterized protein n=1 Tax=Acidithrix ferrooxidans TaxID=1280514 RepID=A0A0D8HHL7_9ACTN|nr:hypothetical protein AXFE_18110 [Acidithrix ferrooxidans]
MHTSGHHFCTFYHSSRLSEAAFFTITVAISFGPSMGISCRGGEIM